MLAKYESLHIRGLAYQPPNLPKLPEVGEFPLQDEGRAESDANVGQIEGITWGWLFPLPTANQPVAAFTPAQKLASVVVIVMVTVFIMGGLLTSYEALSGILGK